MLKETVLETLGSRNHDDLKAAELSTIREQLKELSNLVRQPVDGKAIFEDAMHKWTGDTARVLELFTNQLYKYMDKFGSSNRHLSSSIKAVDSVGRSLSALLESVCMRQRSFCD